MGKHEAATDDLKSAIELNPEAAELLMLDQQYQQAQSNFRDEQYDQAIEELNELLESKSDFVPAQCLRATCYWYSEQFVEAIEDYSIILDDLKDLSNDDSTQLRLSILGARGQVYAELGEYEMALLDLNEVISADQKYVNPIGKAYARNGRGLALTGMEKFAAAEQDFRESIATAPDNAWVHYNLGMLYVQQNRIKEATICFTMALASENPKLRVGRRKKASSFLEKFATNPGEI